MIGNVVPLVNATGQGRELHAFGQEVTILLAAGQTGGQFTLATALVAPGGGPPPHFHENEDELLYVLEGRFSFLVDGQWTETGPGATMFAPRQSVHAFKNVIGQPGKLLMHMTPSGCEDFFADAATESARLGRPDWPRIEAIAAEHGVQFVM